MAGGPGISSSMRAAPFGTLSCQSPVPSSVRRRSVIEWRASRRSLVSWYVDWKTRGGSGSPRSAESKRSPGTSFSSLSTVRRIAPTLVRRPNLRAFELLPLPAREDLREDVHDEHESDEHERRGPGSRLLARIRRLREGEDGHRQRRKCMRHVRRDDARGDRGREEEGCGL